MFFSFTSSKQPHNLSFRFVIILFFYIFFPTTLEYTDFINIFFFIHNLTQFSYQTPLNITTKAMKTLILNNDFSIWHLHNLDFLLYIWMPFLSLYSNLVHSLTFNLSLSQAHTYKTQKRTVKHTYYVISLPQNISIHLSLHCPFIQQHFFNIWVIPSIWVIHLYELFFSCDSQSNSCPLLFPFPCIAETMNINIQALTYPCDKTYNQLHLKLL